MVYCYGNTVTWPVTGEHTRYTHTLTYPWSVICDEWEPSRSDLIDRRCANLCRCKVREANLLRRAGFKEILPQTKRQRLMGWMVNAVDGLPVLFGSKSVAFASCWKTAGTTRSWLLQSRRMVTMTWVKFEILETYVNSHLHFIWFVFSVGVVGVGVVGHKCFSRDWKVKAWMVSAKWNYVQKYKMLRPQIICHKITPEKLHRVLVLQNAGHARCDPLHRPIYSTHIELILPFIQWLGSIYPQLDRCPYTTSSNKWVCFRDLLPTSFNL